MRHLSIFILLFTALSANAQTQISGKVTDQKGQSIPGVNVYIKGTFDGSTTRADGQFAFQTASRDSLVLIASFIGYQNYEEYLRNQTQGLVCQLKEKVNELNAVSITAGTIDVSDEAKSMVMKPLDIVTTAGALADITGALTTLPGAIKVGNDGRLFVRGGDASETAIYFDGLRVANAYGTTTSGLPTRNRFNPSLFKGTFFSTGGYSAEYGDALSSVLALETIDKPVRNQTDLSFMSVGGSAATTFVDEKQSVSAELSYTDLRPYQKLIKQEFDFESAPQALQGQALYRHTLGDDGILKGFVQGSHSKLIIWQPRPGESGRGQRISIENNFGFGNISYKKPLSAKWLNEGGVSLSHNVDHTEIDSAKYQQEDNLMHIKQKFTHYFSDALKLKTGAEVFLRDYSQTNKNLNLSQGYDDARPAAFAEAEWLLSNSLSFRGGVRGWYATQNGDYALEPRIAAAFRPYPKGNISFAAGTFSQDADADVVVQAPGIKDAHAKHLQLSFQHGDGDRLFRIEGYLKKYADLALIENGVYHSAGAGVAKGFDMFFRDNVTFKNLDYWITYNYVHSRRSYDQYPSDVQPSFAPTHNLAVVAKYWVADWKSLIGGTFSWNSGYTYDNPNLEGQMESLSPNYASLSLNWSYLWRENLIVHFACNNVTGRENIYGYQYANQSDVNGQFASLPQGQPAARFFFVGVFWTISKDKQANQLNNL